MRRLAPALVAALALAAPAHAAVDFLPATFYAAHDTPTDVAVGDVTGDRVADIVVANPGSDDVSVIHGVGDGTFAEPAAQFPTGPSSSGPISVALGDSSFRGIQDIYVANYTTPGIALLTGQGAGSFSAPHLYPISLPSRPNFVLPGYLQGIPIPDLYTGLASGGGVAWLPNLFDAMSPKPPAFGGPGQISSSPSTPVAGTTADVDGSGDGDLVLVDGGGTAWFLLGDGNGSSFTTKKTIPSGASDPSGVAAADMNGDGKVDVITSDRGGRACVVLGDGAGGALRAPTCTPAPGSPHGLAVGDVNGDGKVDVVTADLDVFNGSAEVPTVSVLLGDGAGGLAAPVNLTADGAPWAVRLADVNRDGALDIVSADRSSNDVAVFLAAPHPRLAPTAVAFGEQDGLVTSRARSLTIANDGPAPLHVVSALVDGADATSYAVTGSTCTAAVPHGRSCRIDLTFRPFGLGRLNADVRIDLRELGVRTVPLSGIGVLPGPPRIRGLRSVPPRVRAGKPIGVQLSLSRSARLTVTLSRRVRGHRGRGGACLPGRGGGHACTASVRVRLLTVRARLGTDAFTIPGRRRRRPLAPGRYAIAVVARDPLGRASRPAVAPVVVLRNTKR